MSGQNLFPRAPSQKDTRTRRALAKLTTLDMQVAPIPAIIVLDNFAEPNDVNLATHAMDVGQGWVNIAGPATATIIGNSRIVDFDQGGGTGNMVWRTNTGFPNVTGYFSMHFQSPHQAFGGVIFRIQDSNNFTVALVSAISGNFEIYEKIGGTFDVRDSINIGVTYGVRYDIVAALDGTTIKATCSVAGVQQGRVIEYDALTTNTGGTNHGIVVGGVTTSDFAFVDAPFRITTP